MRKRYAVTFIGRDGLRTFVRCNQGRDHFDTPAEAHEWMRAALSDNSAKRLNELYDGPTGVASFAVSPIDCYDHGDAVGCYPDETCDEQGNILEPRRS